MATTYIQVDSNSAGGGDGSSWATSGGSAAYTEAELEAYLEGTVVADTVFWVKDGTYTLNSAWDSSARDGTKTTPILVIGVKSGTTNVGANVVFSDWSRADTDRPFIDGATYGITSGNYYRWHNLSFQSSATYVVYSGTENIFENCKFDNDSAESGAAWACYLDNGSKIFNCELTSAKNNLLRMGQYGTAFFNYLHDSTGASGTNGASYGSMAFNIFDNCTVGLTVGAVVYADYVNNTFYDCDTGISATTAGPISVVNNIFSSCGTDAVKATTQTNGNLFWNNHMYNNGDDWDGIAESGPWADLVATSGDPKFTAAGSDFSLQSSSPCLDAGMSLILGV